MTATMSSTSERAARNSAFLAAESARALSTRDAEVEYSETVCKLREHYESDLAEAAAWRMRAVTPAHRAYNRAVIAAERHEAC